MAAKPTAESVTASAAPPPEFREAVAEDLLQLATLHDRELDAELIHLLHQASFPDNLGLQLAGEAGIAACERSAAGLALLPDPADQEILDWLAVDYADIYLNHSLRASPFESVWLDEDQLVNQQPMFEVRRWYQRYDVAAPNWRLRADDHLTFQLQFLALLLKSAEEEQQDSQQRLMDAATFMDEHMLIWMPDFAVRVSERCGTKFYAGLALLTSAYLEELRDHLATFLDQPRPTREEVDARLAKKYRIEKVEAMCDFSPGAAPSW